MPVNAPAIAPQNALNERIVSKCIAITNNVGTKNMQHIRNIFAHFFMYTPSTTMVAHYSFIIPLLYKFFNFLKRAQLVFTNYALLSILFQIFYLLRLQVLVQYNLSHSNDHLYLHNRFVHLDMFLQLSLFLLVLQLSIRT